MPISVPVSKRLTFSASISLLALALSSFAFLSISCSSISNFLFTPRSGPANSLALLPKPLSSLSNSSLTLLPSSSVLSPSCLVRCSPSLSLILSILEISCFCANRLATAHSRQNMSPLAAHATGVRADCRQRLHDANGRNDSRVSRAVRVPQSDDSCDRSWEVKTEEAVLRLPARDQKRAEGAIATNNT